jgi:hypothetical protein
MKARVSDPMILEAMASYDTLSSERRLGLIVAFLQASNTVRSPLLRRNFRIAAKELIAREAARAELVARANVAKQLERWRG